MTQIDIIDDWSGTSQTKTFTYQNGETVNYTYSASGHDPAAQINFAGPYGDENLDNVAVLGSGTVDGINGAADYAHISFDEPVTNVSVKVYGGPDPAGEKLVAFEVDGVVVDLNTLLMTGQATIVGDKGSSGTDFTDANGELDPNLPGTSETATVTFLRPISTLTVDATFAVGGRNIVTDIFLDDDPQFAPCFTAGTLIDTDRGQIPVETLKAGDMICTKDHGFQPVKWVGGSRVVDRAVRIKAGVFGNARDLVVSPRHRMLLQGWQMGLLFNHDEAFATAYDLKNGTTITVEPEGRVEYFHVLLDRHEVIYAEGAETESFFPDEASLNSMAKTTRAELEAAVDLSTFGRTARPTLTANQAMYLSHNMDLLEDAPNQIAAQ